MSNRWAPYLILLTWLALLQLYPPQDLQLRAQISTATVSGFIVDSTGALIAEVTVSLTNIGTGVVSTGTTNSSGLYRISSLIPGVYRANVSRDGFKSIIMDGIALHVEDAVSINYSMEVGAVSVSVMVEPGQSQVNAESTTVGQVIESGQIEDTPLNGRNVFNLLELVPGVVPQGAASGSPLNNQAAIGNFTNPAGWGNYQIGGGAAGQNAAFVDGAPVSTPIENWLILVPSEDAIQEFKVDSNNASSEYGRFYGGVINFATKSGSNDFHGGASEFFRNTVLNANNTFNIKASINRPPLEQNQYSAWLGGPILRNRLFFFGTWEGYANRSGLPFAARVPTAAELLGDFTADKPVTVPGPNNTTVQVSCNGALNKVCLDPTSNYLNNIFGYWGVPNIPGVAEGGVNFQTNASSGSNANQFTARGDYTLSRHQFFTRYTYWKTNTLATNYFHNTAPSQPGIVSITHQAVIGDTYTINPTIVADVRLSYSRFEYDSFPPTLGKVDLTKIPAVALFANQVTFDVLPVISLSGYSPSAFPYSIINVINFNTFQTYSLVANVSKSAGKHSIRFGGEYRKIGASFLKISGGPTGSFTFLSGSPTNNIFANYDMGAVVANTGGITTTQRFRLAEPYGGVYIMDTFHATAKLTMHAGTRWELPGSFAEKNDLNTVLLMNVVSPLGSIFNPATGANQALNGNLVLVNSPQYPSRYDNSFHSHLFAPNVGLTYRLLTNSVVSAGYSLNYVAYDTGDPSALSTPINSLTTPPTGPLSNPFPQINGVLPKPVGRSPSYSANIQGLAIVGRVPNVPFAYAQQWNLNVQREFGQSSLLQVGYIGSKGTRLPISLNLNALSDAQAATAATQYQSLVASGLSTTAADARTFLNVQVANPLTGKLAAGSAYNGSNIAQGQLLRPFPQFANVTDSSFTEGGSIYHSLQASYRKRFKSAGNVFVSYSWSKLLGTVDTNTGFLESSTVGGYQDPNNLASSRSLESFDVPQRLVLNYSLTLPFGKGRYWLGNAGPITDRLVSGWNASSITTFQKGFPLVLTAQPNDLSKNFGFGAIRPNVVPGCTKAISGSAGSRLGKYFNTACFTQPATPFSIGNESRTDSTLRIPGTDNWDLAVSKDTVIHERFRILFTTQFLNMFNHVQYGQPGGQFGSTSFGVITSQLNNPRQIQFGLKLSF
jgi:hypothetical protein